MFRGKDEHKLIATSRNDKLSVIFTIKTINLLNSRLRWVLYPNVGVLFIDSFSESRLEPALAATVVVLNGDTLLVPPALIVTSLFCNILEMHNVVSRHSRMHSG